MEVNRDSIEKKLRDELEPTHLVDINSSFKYKDSHRCSLDIFRALTIFPVVVD